MKDYNIANMVHVLAIPWKFNIHSFAPPPQYNSEWRNNIYEFYFTVSGNTI